MKNRLPAVLLSAFALVTPQPRVVTITGRVEILDKGDVKRKDASQVVVWVERRDGVLPQPWPPLPKPERPVPVKMASKDKRFQPGVMVVPVGTEVSFPNLDPIFHNVFSLSGDNRFDLGLYKSGKSKSVFFRKPGLVRVYCNIHSQMVGFIHVMATPWSTTTSPDGTFVIRDVPAGTYLLKSWEEKAGEASRELSVGAVDPPSMRLMIDARGFVPKPHLNKFGKQYTAEGSDDERY